MDAPPDGPGLCATHGTPAMIRLRFAGDANVRLDLCMECFHQHAVMTARDADSLAHLHRAAPKLHAQVWKNGATYYLLREAAHPLDHLSTGGV